MSYILTFDIGTTSVKTCLFNFDLKLSSYSSVEYTLKAAQNGIVECNPAVYWEACKNGIAEVLHRSTVKPAEIKAITITTQGETLIPVDEKGNALRDAIVWFDSRAAVEATFINRRFSNSEFYRKTGIAEVTGACPISKVVWIKNNEPDIYKNTYKFMLLEDFIIQKLTGEFVTEKSLMSSTGYFNINTGELWKDILEFSGVDADKFPEILDCGTKVSNISASAASEMGINKETIVVTGAMDQICSAIGAGNINMGMVTETTGTALAIAVTVENPEYDRLNGIPVIRHAEPGKFIILPYHSTAGIILKWFSEEFCNIEAEYCRNTGKSVYRLLDEMAESVPALSNGLLLLPHFAGILLPEVKPEVKGVFFGVGLETKKQHFIRAILEAVAYLLKESIEMLEDAGIEVKNIRTLGGGSRSRIWCDIKANVTGKPIITMEQEETTSLGAAALSSIALGSHKTLEDACQRIAARDLYKPDNDLVKEYDMGYEKYRRLYTSLRDLF